MIGALSLDEAFALARLQRRAALIAYVVAGDPDLATTEHLIDTLSENGADVIELGIPYADPLADGRTISTAAHRALTAGTTPRDVVALVSRARARGSAPILLFTYANPVERMGTAQFALACAAAGAAGAIVPDIPLEEISGLRDAFGRYRLALPLLVAPTTPAHRARLIANASSGFVYVVSRLGVTGAGTQPDLVESERRIEALRESGTTLPLAVGFGLSTPEHIRAVSSFADGVIVGSAIIDAYAGTRGAGAATRAGALVARLRAATLREGYVPMAAPT